MRTVHLMAFAALMTAAMGCEDRAAKQQEKAAEAQREANEKIAKAQNESVTEVTGAQVEADKKINEANASFLKLREDYRHKAQKDLVELDKDIADLEGKAKTAAANKKAEYDAALIDIRAKRAQYTSSYDTLQNATASTWDAAKENTERAWDGLKAAMRKAPGTL